MTVFAIGNYWYAVGQVIDPAGHLNEVAYSLQIARSDADRAMTG